MLPVPSCSRHALAMITARRLAAALGALAVAAAAVAGFPPAPGGRAGAHPGELDRWGGHFNEATGFYHYHRPKMEMAARKREVLVWSDHPVRGVIKGTLSQVARPNAIWIRVGYRPAYQELVPLVSPSNRDDRQQWLRIWLRYVSPEETGRQGKRFSRAFNERVIYELKRKLTGKELSVQFEILPNDSGRLRGLVFLGQQNINLWMVLSGWSFYLISDEDNPYDKLFRQAEDQARRNRSGFWKTRR